MLNEGTQTQNCKYVYVFAASTEIFMKIGRRKVPTTGPLKMEPLSAEVHPPPLKESFCRSTNHR